MSPLGLRVPDTAEAVDVVVRNEGNRASTSPVRAQLGYRGDDAAASGPGWSCDAQLLCLHPGPVAPGQALPTLRLTGTVTGADPSFYGFAQGSTAAATVSGGTAAGSGRQRTAATVGAAGVMPTDLRVVLRPDGYLRAGVPVGVTASVVDDGSRPAGGPVTLSLTVPFAGSRAEGPGWTCTRDLVCTHPGAVLPGALPDLRLTLTAPPGTGPDAVPVDAVVTSPGDAWPDNSSAGLTLPVAALSGPPLLQVDVVGPAAPLVPGAPFSATVLVANRSSQDVVLTDLRVRASGLSVGSVSGAGLGCDGTTCVGAQVVAPGTSVQALVSGAVPADPPSQAFLLVDAGAGLQHATTTAAYLVSERGVDLAPVVSTDGVPAAGTTVPLVVRVSNHGRDEAGPGTQVRLVPSLGSPVLAVSGTGWECSVPRAVCSTRTGVAAGAALPDLQVQLRGGDGTSAYAPLRVLEAEVSHPDDVAPGNDRAAAETATPAADGADLVLAGEPGAPHDAREPGEVLLTVRNLGAGTHTGAVTVQLTPQSALRTPRPQAADGWDCALDPSGGQSCRQDVPVLPGGALPPLRVLLDPVLSAVSPGEALGIRARVVGATDAQHDDDEVAVTTLLRPRPTADPQLAVSPVGVPRPDLAVFDVDVVAAHDLPTTDPVRVVLTDAYQGRVTAAGPGWDCVAFDVETQCVRPGLAPEEQAPPLRATVATFPGRGTELSAVVREAGSAFASATREASASVRAPEPPDRLAVTVGAQRRVRPDQREVRFALAFHNVGSEPVAGPLRAPAGVQGDGWQCSETGCEHPGPVPVGAAVTGTVVHVLAPDDPGLPDELELTAAATDYVTTSARARTSAGGLPWYPLLTVLAPPPGPVGADLTFRVRAGSATTTPTQSQPVRVGAPDGSLVAGDGWTCDAGRTCRHPGAAGPAALPDLLVTVPTSAAGTTTVSAGLDPRIAFPSTASAASGGSPADLVPVLSPDGPLVPGVPQETTVEVRNVGSQPLAGPVEVVLDASVPVAVAGDGWTCQERRCTRLSGVAGGAALPPLIATATAPTDAASGTATLRATVTARGDVRPVDDAAGLLLPVVRPLLASPPVGGAPAPDPVAVVVGGAPGTAGRSSASYLVFSRDVTGVSAGSVQLRTVAGAVVPTRLDCLTEAVAPTPCSAPARYVVLTPTAPVVPGQAHQLLVNPLDRPERVSAGGLPAVPFTSSPFRMATSVQDGELDSAWARVADAGAIGGSYARERGGASLTLPFTGSSVRWWFPRRPDQGLVRVSIDGVVVETVDQWAARPTPRQQRTYTGLAPGPHRLTLAVLGAKRAASTGVTGAVDALSSATATCATGAGCVADPRGLERLRRSAVAVASDGAVLRSDTVGSRVSQPFVGTGVDVVFAIGPDVGRFHAYVDGRLVATRDAGFTRTALSTQAVRGLADGPHVLTVVVAGRTGRAGLAGDDTAVDRVLVR